MPPDASSTPGSVCFVAPTNYALLAGRSDLRHIGGAEVQRVLIARELVRRGWRVSFATLDHGQPDGEVLDGITVYKTCGPSAGWPGLRFVHPRWTGLCAALRRANADVYYQRTAGAETGQTALWCRRNRRRFVLGIANDPECDRRYGGRHRSWRDRWLYAIGLRRADAVIAQTRSQQEMLRRNLQIEAALIRSCAPDPGEPPADREPRRRGRRLLWVGRFSVQKRVDWLADLAALSPDTRIEVAGGSRNAAPDARAAAERLAAMPHVTLHGVVPHERMGELYDRAALLISTSAWEGYPNVFMEAWSRAVPTVSTFDPDGVVAAHGIGAVGATVAELRAAAERLLASPDAYAEASRRARQFFLANHTVAATVDAFERVLLRMTGP